MTINHCCRFCFSLALTFLFCVVVCCSASVLTAGQPETPAKPLATVKADKDKLPPITLDPFDKPDAEKVTLRYQFHPKENIRWTVECRQRVEASMGGKNQSTESADRSTKCWRILDVTPEGTATFESLYEDMNMYQKMSGQNPVRYNSKKDKTPPPGFADAAKRVGHPFARVKLNRQGVTLERTALVKEAQPEKLPQVTTPLPAEPVAVGQSWRQRHEHQVPLRGGLSKTIIRETVYTLKSVKTGVATIEWANQILTPVHSAEIEVKLIPYYTHGKIRFDVDAGRILSQQIDLDHQVIGFQGADSSYHHVTRTTEKLLPKKATPAKAEEKPKK